MDSLPASQRQERARRSRRGGGPVGALVVGAGLVAGLVVVGGRVVVRIRRLRRTAVLHAHDLDHAATVGEGTGAPVHLLVLGDSAARGYGLSDPATVVPALVASGVSAAVDRPVRVEVEATDGHRTADVLALQAPTVPAARPDVVLISVGVNDAIGRTPDRALRGATADLLDAVLRGAPDAVVVLVPCPDLGAAPGFPWPLGAVVGWRCRRVARVQAATAAEVAARTGRSVPVVPLPRPDTGMFGVDGFHPGVAGHAAMAEVVTPVVLHALASEPGGEPARPHVPHEGPPDRLEPAWTSD